MKKYIFIVLFLSGCYMSEEIEFEEDNYQEEVLDTYYQDTEEIEIEEEIIEEINTLEKIIVDTETEEEIVIIDTEEEKSTDKLFFTRKISIENTQQVWEEKYNEIIPGAQSYSIITSQNVDDTNPYTGFVYYENNGVIGCAYGIELNEENLPQCIDNIECGGWAFNAEEYYCSREKEKE